MKYVIFYNFFIITFENMGESKVNDKDSKESMLCKDLNDFIFVGEKLSSRPSSDVEKADFRLIMGIWLENKTNFFRFF